MRGEDRSSDLPDLITSEQLSVLNMIALLASSHRRIWRGLQI
ncbi:unnamed protein product [Gulo gulo]|uniref:Uncharacterized protein n=1 Tax=Gulo gulo TaxID=48420 RepID=A0A9X9M321_GULGU|nr:unnamed protein product [Gulo gulo]